MLRHHFLSVARLEASSMTAVALVKLSQLEICQVILSLVEVANGSPQSDLKKEEGQSVHVELEIDARAPTRVLRVVFGVFVYVEVDSTSHSFDTAFRE